MHWINREDDRRGTAAWLWSLALCAVLGWPLTSAKAQDNAAAADETAQASDESGARDESAAPPTPRRRPFSGEFPRGEGGRSARPPAGEDEAGEDDGEPSPRFGRDRRSDGSQADDGQVSVSFSNAEMRQIAQFFMRQLNKPVIIHDAIREQRISIIADQRLPARQAMELIGNALRQKGVMIIEGPNQIDFLPLSEARHVTRPVIGPDVSVQTLENQSQIVDKVFDLKHYDVRRLQEVLQPMLPEYAFIFSDPNLNRLVVTDAATNLRRIEQMIERLDVPKATQTVTRIFRLEHGDAGEIVAMLRVIIAGTLPAEQGRAFATTLQGGESDRNRRGSRFTQRGGPSAPPPGSNLVLVEQNDSPILLQAEISRNWIIAVAAPSVIELVEQWIEELDRPKETDEPYTLIDVRHADITELNEQLAAALESLPDMELRNSVRVVAFPKSRRLMVYGSQRGRRLVEQLLQELDVETAAYQIFKEIPLHYTSAESIASQIEELFSAGGTTSFTPWGGWGGRNQQASSAADVRVTYDIQRNSVTIMTDPVKMQQIEQLIAEQWDRPINVADVQPKIYYLKYTDPVQVQALLEDMFSSASTSTSGPWYAQTVTSSPPSGRLAGQFSFQALRGTNILTVSSSSQSNYVVIDRVLEEIDRPQEAGLPIIIELKHANAEDVAEQLNATFSEPGTPAQISRTERGLSQALREGTTATQTQQQPQQQGGQQNQQNQVQAGSMGFWWAQSRVNTQEQPTSNLIGKPRFVPVNRRNALMILAPTGYLEPLQELVAELDKPGSQVLIQAIIAEVQHDDESTLGMRLANDPTIFADSRLADQAFGGTLGGEATGERAFDGFFSGTGILSGEVNLNFLIQLLIRKVNLTILNEPRVYTSDNQEAHFFDGQDIPFVSGDQTSTEGAAVRRTFENREVGTRLHVRPHITQEGDVNLEVNLELSNRVLGETVFGNIIVNRRSTTTNVTLKDGQTVVISGIIRKEDVNDVRKLPLLGDIPLVGGIFRSTEKSLRNREVVAFITPRIVNPASPDAEELSAENRQWLQRVRDAMRQDGDADDGVPGGMRTEADAPEADAPHADDAGAESASE